MVPSERNNNIGDKVFIIFFINMSALAFDAMIRAIVIFSTLPTLSFTTTSSLVCYQLLSSSLLFKKCVSVEEGRPLCTQEPAKKWLRDLFWERAKCGMFSIRRRQHVQPITT